MNDFEDVEVLPKWYVVSRLGSQGVVRHWWAEDREHAVEQHMDAFPDEEIVEVYLPDSCDDS